MISIVVALKMQTILHDRKLFHEGVAEKWRKHAEKYASSTDDQEKMRLQHKAAELLVQIHTDRARETEERIVFWERVEAANTCVVE